MTFASPSEDKSLDNAPLARLETVIVSGKVPGPGLWTVHHGDHTLWILGEVQPVIRRMEWETDEVVEKIAASEKVLLPARLKFDLGMGAFRQMLLIPALLGARKSPEKAQLESQVSAEDYARWQVLKARYLGKNRKVETFRPIFAANELTLAALKKQGLAYRGLVLPLVEKVTKRHSIPVERPEIEVVITDARSAIHAFREANIEDAECFSRTLDHLENDLETMRFRAEAWALGDMAALEELSFTNPGQACSAAMLESNFAQQQGLHDVKERLDTLWLEQAEKMIHEHKNSFAVFPVSQLVGKNGMLATLRAHGYRVEPPRKNRSPVMPEHQ